MITHQLGHPDDDLILTPEMRVRDPWLGRIVLGLIIFVVVLTWPTAVILCNWLSGGYR